MHIIYMNYIYSRGFSKSYTRKNNKVHKHEYNWQSDYDGKKGNVSFNVNQDGKIYHRNFIFNNNNLRELLNKPSINLPIEKRLMKDFGNGNIITKKSKTKKTTHKNKNKYLKKTKKRT